MDDWNHWMVWMDHDRYPGSEKIILFNFESFFNISRQLAMYGGKINAALFKNIPVLNNAGSAAAAAIPLPFFFFKMCFAIA